MKQTGKLGPYSKTPSGVAVPLESHQPTNICQSFDQICFKFEEIVGKDEKEFKAGFSCWDLRGEKECSQQS